MEASHAAAHRSSARGAPCDAKARRPDASLRHPTTYTSTTVYGREETARHVIDTFFYLKNDMQILLATSSRAF
jgi:hypothetical protein